MIKRIIAPLVILVFVGISGFAQSADEKEVAAAVEALKKAMIDADKAALEKLSADDLSYGHSSGVVEDKVTFVDKIATGKSDFVSITLSEQTIKVVGQTALVRHKFAGESMSNGKVSPINIAVLLVWHKQNGQWKLLARQAVKLQ